MKRRRSADADHVRRRKDGARKAARASAERRRCPSCKRGAAVITMRDGDYTYRRCRWCPFEEGHYHPHTEAP